MRIDVDVAVVGSGFAGSLIAAIARRLGRSAVLLERGTHPRFAIGESSTPLANLVLLELSRRYGLPRLASLTSYGSWRRAYPDLVCGLKRGFSFLSHRPGEPFGADPERRDQLLVAASPTDEVADTHWLRADVDTFFVAEAAAQGVTYLDHVTLDTATPRPSGMELSGTRAGARLEVRARLVVDASGPRGFLWRALALREASFPGMPVTESLFTHVEGARRLDGMGLFPWDGAPYPVDDAALHHVFPGGWIWVLRFGNGVTSVGVVATRPLAERLRLAEGAPAWERLLDELPTVAAQLRGARPVRPFRHLPRVAFRSGAVTGPGWTLLPSAAAFVDPLLSTGFALTLLGVERIARAIEEEWGTPRLEARLAAHGRATLLEADATSRLMAALHATFTRFELFSGLSLLYFAAASFAETVRRLGRDPGAFLLADHPRFGPAFVRLCRRAARGDHTGLPGEIARAIEPFDVAGLGDPARRSWYPADPRDLLVAAGKVGATTIEVERMLAASGIAAPVTRRGRIVAVAVALGLAAALATALWALPRVIERRVATTLVREAARRGLRLRIGQVRFRWLSPLLLHDLELEGARGVADVKELEVRWRPALGPRTAWVKGVAARGARVLLPEQVVIALASEDWDVLDLSAHSARLARHAGRGRITGAFSAGGRAELVFADLDLGRLRVTRGGAPLADPGLCDGRLDLLAEPGQPVRLDGVVRSAGVRFAGFSAETGPGGLDRGGAPTPLEVAFTAELDPAAGRARVDCARVVANGVEVALEGTLLAGSDDVWFDVALDVKRVELAPLLLAAGLDLPRKVATPSGDLGSVALVARLLGQLSDPASIAVEEKLSFVAPREAIPALEALKVPFAHTVRLSDGTSCVIDVAEGSQDFVALEDVPPLFLRALTISEDAGFWGHRGIDLREIPVAWATNRLRGTPSRGASTITQQLAKNLFLTREKSYGRKLQELALTFLLESTLGKRRILEVYLNVIEWGPALHGLRPACRTYFRKEPRDLTVKEMAYLVCLVPSPVRYQTSFEKGQLTPGFAPLVTNLLAKLRSVDAITEEEYLLAREEPMAFAR